MPSPYAHFAVNDLSDEQPAGDDLAYRLPLGDMQLRLSEPYWVNEALFGKVLLFNPRTKDTLFSAKVDLVDLNNRERLNRQLDMFSPEGVSWAPLVHAFFARVMRGISRSEAPVQLSSVPPRENVRIATAGGFPLLLEDPTVLFADGGARKSLLALWWSAQLSYDVPVLYLDWEMRAEDHQERLVALCGDEPFPNLWYLTARAPLAIIEDSLRDYIKSHGIQFLIIDSAAPAAAIEGPEIPTEFFGVLKRLHCGALILAHINRLKDTEKPFGSSFWHNFARASWYLEGQQGGYLELTCRKDSFGRFVSTDPKGLVQMRYKVVRSGDATEIVLAAQPTFTIEHKEPAPIVQEDEP